MAPRKPIEPMPEDEIPFLNEPVHSDAGRPDDEPAPEQPEESEDSQIVKAPTLTLGERGVEIPTFDAARLLAAGMLRNGLVPFSYIRKRNDTQQLQLVTSAILKLRRLELPPETSLAFTYPVDNRIAIYSDAVQALIAKSGLEADAEEFYEGEPGTDDYQAVSRTRRYSPKGELMQWREERFSVADAKTAGLFRNETYTKYLRYMLMWRARHKVQRNAYSDVLLGVEVAHHLDGGGVAVIGGAQDIIDGVPFSAASVREQSVQNVTKQLAESGGVIDPTVFSSSQEEAEESSETAVE